LNAGEAIQNSRARRRMMKERLIRLVSGLSVALLMILALAAWTETQPVSHEPRLITVTGDAQLRVIPDEVILTLGVETWDKDLDTATAQNDAIVKRVLALASDYGIDPEHIQTDYVSIEPRYRNGYYEERDFVGFFVRKTIVITLRDISKFEDLLADTLGAGVNYVHGIDFRTTDLRTHRDEARSLAIKAAHEKAAAMAGELSQTVGEPRLIREEHSGWWSSYSSWWGSHWGGTMAQNVIQEVASTALTGESSVAPGQISVNARVTVSFELSR
jgi:uncharacterized protein YggE